MNDKLIMKDGKPHKIAQVVMLPTEKDIPCKNSIIKSNITNKLNIFDPYGIGFLNKDKNQVMQHLYILSSEEIKEGDWYMYCHFGEWIISNSRETLKNKINTLENLNKDDYFKKIIATTDSEVKIHVGTCFSMEELFKPLPRPSDDFIKAFVKAQGKITKVLVEYEADVYNECPFTCEATSPYSYKLKVAKDNTITIKPTQEDKTSWSREEIVALIQKLEKDGADYFGQAFLEQWIEENL